jgi:hypothetical protein
MFIPLDPTALLHAERGGGGWLTQIHQLEVVAAGVGLTGERRPEEGNPERDLAEGSMRGHETRTVCGGGKACQGRW